MRALALLFLVSAGLQLGCQTRVSLGNACRSDSECSGGLRCNFGRCRAGCTDSAQCGAGEHCLTIEGGQGACTLPSDTCNPDAQRYCEDGLTCVNQSCVSLCGTTSNACLPGTSCDMAALACLPATLVVPDGGMDASAMEPDAGDAGPDAFCLSTPPVTFEPRTICVGDHFACAIRGGRVYCWGSNDGGQMGDGVPEMDTPDTGPADAGLVRLIPRDHEPLNIPPGADPYDRALAPVAVRTYSGELTDVRSVSCGENFACALQSDGVVMCWGTLSQYSTPVATPVLSGASSLHAGRKHACARVAGEYQCWGENSFNLARYPEFDGHVDGRLGLGIVGTSAPMVAVDFSGASLIELGSVFTCTAECGGVYCQGASEGSVCGNAPVFGTSPSGGRVGLPVVVRTANRILDGVPTDIHAGIFHACVLIDGRVQCFGGNSSLQLGTEDGDIECLGTGSHFCSPIPLAVVSPPGRLYTRLGHGVSSTSCAITAVDGQVDCWGDNGEGRAGMPDPFRHGRTLIDTPVRQSSMDPLTGVREVAVGASSVCAVLADGAVYCWGANGEGQLGQGEADINEHSTALPVSFP